MAIFYVLVGYFKSSTHNCSDWHLLSYCERGAHVDGGRVVDVCNNHSECDILCVFPITQTVIKLIKLINQTMAEMLNWRANGNTTKNCTN